MIVLNIANPLTLFLLELTEVEFVSGLLSIEESAFAGCDLYRISLPSSLLTIEDRAFSDCHSLKTINIPASITMIGNDVFKNCFDFFI